MITTFPGNQLVYGSGATYNVSAIPTPWQGNGTVTYWYRQMDTMKGGPSPWKYTTGGLSWSTIETIPGIFQIYAMVPIATQQIPGQQQWKTTIMTATITVTVLPPDGITLPQGLTSNWNLGMQPKSGLQCLTNQIEIAFPVTCSGLKPGGLPNAIPLEDVTGVSYAFDKIRDKKGVKITEGGIAGTSIFDEKTMFVPQEDPNWNRFIPNNPNVFPPNFPFVSYKQTLKLQIPDLNGDPKIFTLSPTFTYTQTSTTVVTKIVSS